MKKMEKQRRKKPKKKANNNEEMRKKGREKINQAERTSCSMCNNSQIETALWENHSQRANFGWQIRKKIPPSPFLMLSGFKSGILLYWVTTI